MSIYKGVNSVWVGLKKTTRTKGWQGSDIITLSVSGFGSVADRRLTAIPSIH